MRFIKEYVEERRRLGPTEFAFIFGHPSLIGSGIIGDVCPQESGKTFLAIIPEEQQLAGENVVGRVWLIKKSAGRPSNSVISMGRDKNNDLVIPEFSVSKKQACFRCSPEGVYVIDSGSRNGTVVNGQQIPPHIPCRLTNGDWLRLGRLRCTFLTRQGFLDLIGAHLPPK